MAKDLIQDTICTNNKQQIVHKFFLTFNPSTTMIKVKPTKRVAKAAVSPPKKSSLSEDLKISNTSPVSQLICERFKESRKRAGLNQMQFGESLGLSRSYVNAVEGGRFCPNNDTMALWAVLYKLDMNWVFGLEDKERIKRMVLGK